MTTMNRRTAAEPARRRVRSGSSLGRWWALLAALMLLAVGSVPTAPVHAASTPAQADTVIRASEQYVFSVGIVDRVSNGSLTLRFDDGSTETYTVDSKTAIQSQNADALTLADLEIGEMAIVLTVENDPLAVTVVSGGQDG